MRVARARHIGICMSLRDSILWSRYCPGPPKILLMNTRQIQWCATTAATQKENLDEEKRSSNDARGRRSSYQSIRPPLTHLSNQITQSTSKLLNANSCQELESIWGTEYCHANLPINYGILLYSLFTVLSKAFASQLGDESRIRPLSVQFSRDPIEQIVWGSGFSILTANTKAYALDSRGIRIVLLATTKRPQPTQYLKPESNLWEDKEWSYHSNP